MKTTTDQKDVRGDMILPLRQVGLPGNFFKRMQIVHYETIYVKLFLFVPWVGLFFFFFGGGGGVKRQIQAALRLLSTFQPNYSLFLKNKNLLF